MNNSDKLIIEAQVKIDNFDKIAQLMEFNSPDDFYFIQIIKRWKDNPNQVEKEQGIKDGTYHGGAWYLKSWRVHSPQELLSLKPEIIKWCEDNNARGYITINTRSESETDNFVKIYQMRYPQTDARYQHAEDIVAGQAKSGDNWRNTRLRLFLDVDTTNRKVWDEVRRMLDYYNIKVLGEYETPSGGLHILLSNKNNRNLYAFKKECAKFDKFKDLGRLATVHANEDGKIILYSNVITPGYIDEGEVKNEIKNLVFEVISQEKNDFQEKVAEITNGEPVYHRPKDVYSGDKLATIKSLFRRGFSREYTGDNGGNMYGPGVYNVYELRSSNEKARGYGHYIVKSYVIDGYKDFLIFNEDIAKKYYGKDYRIEKQIEKLMPRDIANSVLQRMSGQLYMNNQHTSHSLNTSVPAVKITSMLGNNINKTKVRGIIYSGNHDGCCAFVRDFTDVCPYAYSDDNGKSWKVMINEYLVNHVTGNIDTEFELKGRVTDTGKKQYDDVAKKSINGHAIVYKNNKVNYYSVEKRALISNVWFDEGFNFDEHGYADVMYHGIKLCVFNDNGTYLITDENGTELCSIDELPNLVENN